jgi:phage shock protein E
MARCLRHIPGMPRDIDRTELQRLAAEGAAILEVLPAEEYQQEHLPGAISLPLENLGEESAADAIGHDKRRTAIVYCQSVD